MAIFSKKPRIIKGHTFGEYLSRYGKEYIDGKRTITRDVKELKPFRRYWLIDGEYYEIGFKKETRLIFTIVSILSMITVLSYQYTFVLSLQWSDITIIRFDIGMILLV